MDFDNLGWLDSDDPDVLRARLLATDSALMIAAKRLSIPMLRELGKALAQLDVEIDGEIAGHPFLSHMREELDRLSLILLDLAAER
ncbi:hypothetical protein [Candidatus Poriferisodalis sp.]|uniref:hypothetical protein n=1 Tax=Candidatus Poriferisodalis sp. TaxID=3101277 RepID=UPI003B52FDF3